MEPRKREQILSWLGWQQVSYWQWADDGTAVEWLDGPTIAFLEELAIVCERQGQRELPPLGAILILLTACREGWLEGQSALIRDISEISCLERSMPDWIGDVLVQLDRVHALPRSLVDTPAGKAELVDYVFDDPRARVAPVTGAEVAELLRCGVTREQLREGQTVAVGDLWRDLSLLRQGLARFDPEGFARRMRTGVDHELKSTPLDVPPAERVRGLLDTLADDPNLGGIVRIARQLLAAVALPRPLLHSDDLPLGGVSDITNRGSLDRLLVSELASDDLVLATRVATNEALYLRREQPPKAPPHQRRVLLDCGVRQWGVPRLIATSLGMAFSATRERQLETIVYRASGTQIQRLDLTCREGLERHLACVESDAHPGAVLPLLASRPDEKRKTETIVVTSLDALEDRDFRQALRSAAHIQWIATTERDGRVGLWKTGPRSLRLVREVRLDLEQIVQPTRGQPRPVRGSDWQGLPAYCRLTLQPLRVPHRVALETAWHLPGTGVLSITPARRLTLWDNERFGPREIAENLPPGRLHWADVHPLPDMYTFVVGTFGRRGLHIVRVTPDFGEVLITRLPLDPYHGAGNVTGDHSHIYVLAGQNVHVFSRAGQRVAEGVVPPQLLHVRQRFFRSVADHHLYVLACDGHTIRFERLPQPRAWLTALQPIASSDPWVMDLDGSLCNASTGKTMSLVSGEWGSIFRVAYVSRDDQTIAVQMRGKWPPYLVHVSRGPLGQLAPHHVESQVAHVMRRSRSLRRRFQAIGLTDQQNLALISPAGRVCPITTESGDLVLRDSPLAREKLRFEQPFRTIDAPEGYRLAEARWSDGTRAWLDSRCLLHLRSSQSRIPEVTIVLQQGPVAGWCTDGRLFGDLYFVGPDTQEHAPGTRVQNEILLPLARELR